MSMFGAYMEKYCDGRQHQLSRLSHLREGARELYNKVQAESRVSHLEKDSENALPKWAKLAKKRVVQTAQVKKVWKLETDVDELEKSIS